MNRRKPALVITLASLILLSTTGCEQVSEVMGQSSSTGEQTTRPAGWADETHGNDADPNYEIVFPQDGVPGWAGMTPENPIWVPATIEFNGLTWANVGVRYKGNSSLRSGWKRSRYGCKACAHVKKYRSIE